MFDFDVFVAATLTGKKSADLIEMHSHAYAHGRPFLFVLFSCNAPV